MRNHDSRAGIRRFTYLMGFAACLCAPTALSDESCSSDNAKELTAQLDDIFSIVVETGPAELRIVGDATRTDLRAAATTCDSDNDATVRLQTSREGAVLRVSASSDSFRRGFLLGSSTSLRVSLAVPAGARIEVARSNGPTLIQGVARVDVQGGSGTLQISDIAGDVVARNGVGAAYLSRIAGNVEARDGAGELLISKIGGSLRVLSDAAGQLVIDDVHRDVLIDADGSGEISITRVSGDVRVDQDGSGRILVHGVGGAFSVGEKSRGLIKYSAVAGPVQVPALPTPIGHHHK